MVTVFWVHIVSQIVTVVVAGGHGMGILGHCRREPTFLVMVMPPFKFCFHENMLLTPRQA